MYLLRIAVSLGDRAATQLPLNTSYHPSPQVRKNKYLEF